VNDLPFALGFACRRFANETALVQEGRVWTYDRLRQKAAQTAAYLLEDGLQKGDRVALYGEPSAEYIISLWAIIAAGAIAVPLNTRLPQEALLRQIRQTPR